MEHIKYDLGRLQRGSTVVVTLKNRANVLLMTASNYRSYSGGRQARYIGGEARQSPIRLPVPSDDHWFVALDLGGNRGTIQSSVAVEPPPRGALPAIQDQGSLRSIHRGEPEVSPAPDLLGGQVWDVFVSHASEDKDVVAQPLATALEGAGVSVWLDAAELRILDSLRRKIDQGIRSSRFAVVVVSSNFFAKGWTQYELDGIATMTVAGRQALLPIWHNVTKDEVLDHSPSLADKVARSTATHTVQEIASEIAAVVKDGSGRARLQA
ncbi:MAG: DUF1883 domain-containing protein [Actinomycetota bacterium]|nr:DUF1883 domain-containing protein [Actinomycetota bacterium]